jgi:membrane protein YqaA with SNARE-associated domain
LSATSHGLGAGLVFGIVLVLLLQQFAYLDLSALGPAVEYLLAGAVVGGVLGALIGWCLGRVYLHRHPDESTP